MICSCFVVVVVVVVVVVGQLQIGRFECIGTIVTSNVLLLFVYALIWVEVKVNGRIRGAV